MTNGSQVICAAVAYPAAILSTSGARPFVRDNKVMPNGGSNPQRDAHLRKHADYQRIYKGARKQFSPSMSYFFRLRAENELSPVYSGPRVGLTTGRVLGKAVERNRIKRRMRAAVRANLPLLPEFADVVLHPRKLVLEVEFAKLEREVAKVFAGISAQATKIGGQA
jgi:ribonuclease P protein component